ncbi:hydrogenase maturation protease [Pyrolobus fumarii 1A]|uniref:Hydrogenase maturation protease n=1 Tax=Pyrolobus fumarii (strain DSM 11204 / 1A) TaxID=694429 RepID=G0EE39_PYRF1|nr:hydrogenase maturation protease [Pyrolobus fumarii]AEM37955.1 hydrogenase maturation protease [Pyrolobus fumarii 1A]
MSELRKPLVIGAGNPMFADDAVGYCVARILEECLEPRDSIDVLALQALDPGVVAYFEGHDPIVIVDAVDPATMPSGARIVTYEIDPRKLSLNELAESLTEASSHEANPVNLALIAHASGTLEGRMFFVGLRIHRIELGGGISHEGCMSIQRGVEEVLRILRETGTRASLIGGCSEQILRKECACP